MTDKPFFSIIIPIYNVERYLSKCLDSIVNQSFVDYELILINDGSTDSSSEIIRSYQKKYANILTADQSNSGPGIARNKGIELAKGTYIWFIDSDDTIKENSLSLLHKELSNEAVFVDTLLFTYELAEEKQNGIAIRDKVFGITPHTEDGIYDGQAALEEFLNLNVYTSLLNKIFSRALITEHKLYFTPHISAEDMLHNVQCLFFSKNVKILKQDFYSYFKREGSITNESSDIHVHCIFEILHRIRSFLIHQDAYDKTYNLYAKFYWSQILRIFDTYVDDGPVERIKLFLTGLDSSRSTFDASQEIMQDVLKKDKQWAVLLNKLSLHPFAANEQNEDLILTSFHIPARIALQIISAYMTSNTPNDLFKQLDNRVHQIEQRLTQSEKERESFESRIQQTEQAITIIASIIEDSQQGETVE